MLTRRMFLRTGVAAAAVMALGPDALARDGRIAGYSVKCLGHLMAGALDVGEIEAVYLSPAITGARFWTAVAEQAPHGALTAAHRQQVTAWLDAGVIRPLPPEAGLVGRRVWVRDGAPYWPPKLYGPMLPRVVEAYGRYA